MQFVQNSSYACVTVGREQDNEGEEGRRARGNLSLPSSLLGFISAAHSSSLFHLLILLIPFTKLFSSSSICFLHITIRHTTLVPKKKNEHDH